MSRGLGGAQRAILKCVTEEGCVQVADLAYLVGVEIRQTRRAVRALEGRGLVAVEKLRRLQKSNDDIGRQGSALVVFTPEVHDEWLRNRPSVSVITREQIAELFGVSVSTIARDMAALREQVSDPQ